jgi:hypothetical protein
MLRAGVHRLSEADAVEVAREMAANGARVIFFPSNIHDKASLITGIRATAPLDPPLASETNWDALEDSLWEGLRGLPENTIVIVWPSAIQMSKNSPTEYGVAEGIFADLATSLTSSATTGGTPKELIFIIT